MSTFSAATLPPGSGAAGGSSGGSTHHSVLGSGTTTTVHVNDAVQSYRLMEAMRHGDVDGLAALAAAAGSPIPTLPADLAAKFGSVLHLAIALAPVRVAEWLLNHAAVPADLANAAHPQTGETPLHVAVRSHRRDLIDVLLAVPGINDGARDAAGRRPMDVAPSEEVRQVLADHQAAFVPQATARMHALAEAGDFAGLQALFGDARTAALVDINHRNPATGNTVLHEAARLGNEPMARWCLTVRSADPFVRDRKGKYFYEVTKNDDIKALFKRSISAASPMTVAPDQMPHMQGILCKWTNYASGYKARWFVLDQGILSYYKHQDDVPNSCRGSIHLKIATLWIDSSDRHRFDIIGKGSVRYHLRADHVAETMRWIHAIRQTKLSLNDADRQRRAAAAAAASSSTPALPAGSSQDLAASSSGQLPEDPAGAAEPGMPLNTPLIDSRAALADPNALPPLGQRRASVGSLLGDADQEDADDDAANGSAAASVPHPTKLAMSVNAIRMQLEMQAHLVAGIVPGTVPDPQVASTLRLVTATVASLMDEIVRMTEDREAYWRRRCDAEQTRKTAFETALANLAQEYQVVESEARTMADTLRRQHKLKVQAAGGSAGRRSPAAPAPALIDFPTTTAASQAEQAPVQQQQVLDPAQLAAVAPTDQTATPTFTPAAAAAVELAPALTEPERLVASWIGADEDTDEDDDDDDEFFDAIGDEEAEETTKSSGSTSLMATSARGYETPTYSFSANMRTALPVDHALIKSEVSLWSVLKNAVGKDLTRITLPVHFNEPVSMLQRLCEEVDYAPLLDMAWKRERSDERLLLVAAFAMSGYASTVDRVGKPFNPLLGETFEYVRADRGYRYVAEQVSHHPPISACHCESEHWEFYEEVFAKNSFWGRSFEIQPQGVCHVKIKRDDGVEHYSWRKVTTSVHNLIVGTLYIDHHGDLEVTNHTTREKLVLTFKPTGWRNRDRCAVEGKLFDARGTATWSLHGTWDDKLVAKPLAKDARAFSLSAGGANGGGDDAASVANGKNGGNSRGNSVTLWKRHPCVLTESNFHLTPFAISLNELPATLKPVLCPTDARLRPDQRAMEEGRYDDAATEKNRLEEKQRAARRTREAQGLGHAPHVPKWFTVDHDADSGERYWRFTGEYWAARDRGDWAGVPDIY
ncbi:hypothetical protein H9P43_001276 [Blastocladiella emersonii ATCC 22665]|nr:hypothetical protein H9P43_001276 [Blastocladiella emersonii ATCC 22665]